VIAARCPGHIVSQASNPAGSIRSRRDDDGMVPTMSTAPAMHFILAGLLTKACTIWLVLANAPA
jgi:hypothetical protein